MSKIDFGIGDVLFFKINQLNGDRIVGSGSFTDVNNNTINYNDYIVTVPFSLTSLGIDFVVNEDIIIQFGNTNNYTYGKILSDLTIGVDIESEINNFLNFSGTIYIYVGTSAGIFRGVGLNVSSNGVGYKGQYIIDKELYFNDVEVSVNINEMILNYSAVNFINGLSQNSLSSINAVSFVNNPYRKRLSRPLDIAVLIIKRRTSDIEKNEEIYCSRVSTGMLSVPFNRNKYITSDYKMNLMRKSAGSNEVILYTIEMTQVSLEYLFLLWEDAEYFLWEDSEDFVTDLMEI